MCTPAMTSKWTINRGNSLSLLFNLIRGWATVPIFWCEKSLTGPLRPCLENIHYLGESASAGFFLLRSKNGLSHFFFVRKRKLVPILPCHFVLASSFCIAAARPPCVFLRRAPSQLPHDRPPLLRRLGTTCC